jgi:hypothetical protein
MNYRKIHLTGIILLLLFCAACSNSSKISAEDKLATAQFLAATIMAQTEQASIPTVTNTSQPTETLTPTAESTATATLAPTPMAEADTNGYISPTPTQTPFLAAYMVTPLKFVNQSNESIYFMFTSPIQDEYTFTGNFGIQVPFGTYKYLAWIGNDGPYAGSIEVRGYDKIEIIFKSDRVKIVYP